MSERWVKWCLGVLLVALAAAIVAPNFVKAKAWSNRQNCFGNLKQIDSAVQQWALENKKENTDAPVMSEVIQYLPEKKLPQCPQGGTYRLGDTVVDPPTCSLAKTLGHSLPDYHNR